MGPRERGAGFVVEDPLAMIRVSTFHDTEQRESSGSLTKDRRRPSEARVAAAAASVPPAEETEGKGPSSGSVRRRDSPVTGATALETIK